MIKDQQEVVAHEDAIQSPRIHNYVPCEDTNSKKSEGAAIKMVR